MIIKVAIIEDENEISQSLFQIINNAVGFESKHIFSNAEDAIRIIPKLDLDVVLTDINLTGKSGIDCIRDLKAIRPELNFMICTSFEDANSIFNALKAGATGYLVKTIEPVKLLEAIREIHNGGSPMSSQIARKVVNSFNTKTDLTSIHSSLTKRETEILDYLSKGFRYKEIAEKLHLSTETVRTHIRNIYKKLQVNSRTDALNSLNNKKKDSQ